MINYTSDQWWCVITLNKDKTIGPAIGPGTFEECENQIKKWLKADNVTLTDEQAKTLHEDGVFEYADGDLLLIETIVPLGENNVYS